MFTNTEKLIESGCNIEKSEKICRSRGGESCAFDGAMIVLQPIADSAHIVHGPICCCGNSWEGRGTFSAKGNLHKMGFTTDMNELDIIYGSEEKLYKAIVKTYNAIKPKAIFVYATCVSGLIGEDIEAVCRKAESKLNIRVIPVNSPGFVGPKNLGNRIAGKVLLDYVIGTGQLPEKYFNESEGLINLIGEYNIAGDLWLVEPVLEKAGIKILSKITGDSTFEEITYAHKAKLNVVVCSRALINIAKEMESRYAIPYVEVSFFGKTEMSKALRLIGSKLSENFYSKFQSKIEELISAEEKNLDERLKEYSHLKGKKAVLYTGGVKSWSLISALMDLGIEIVAVGVKKSTFEDEEKIREILGEEAPLFEDVTAKNILKIMRDKRADILIAGGRNQYLAIKEGYPFVDVNQERHIAYAGYDGLINLAEQISNSLNFFGTEDKRKITVIKDKTEGFLINPLKHSQSVGATIAFQGIDRALPIIHGAQGCSFLIKVLLTKHFREPIALASTKLFVEDVVMGSEDNIRKTVKSFIEKNNPHLIGIITSGLTEVKGDDVFRIVKELEFERQNSTIVNVSTADYEDGLERGYAKVVEELVTKIASQSRGKSERISGQINVLAGCHLTPADFSEIRQIIESFGLKPIILPDLSALDGSRQDFSVLATGGTKLEEILNMGRSEFTLALGLSMENAAKILKDRFGIEYRLFESISGLRQTDIFIETLSMLGNIEINRGFDRQRRILIDGMRDAHFYYGGKKICLATERDLSAQMASWLTEMGAEITIVDVNSVDLFSLDGNFDLLISNSHAEDTAKRLGVKLYQMGFPVYKNLGYPSKLTIGYRGTLGLINEIANLLMKSH